MSLKPPFLSLLTSVTAVFNMGLMPAPRNVVLIELTTDDDCFVYGYSLPSSSSTVNIPIVLKKSSSRSIPSQEELAILHLPFPEAITFRSIVSFFYEAQIQHTILSFGVYSRQTSRCSRADYTYIKFLYFRHNFTFKLSGP